MSFGLLFLVAVLAEVASLVVVGSWLGALPTFGLLALSFALGFVCLSGRGIRTVKSAMGATTGGESVTPALVNGAMLAVAGLLFIIPGFVSDLGALVLALPPTRAVLRGRAVIWLRGRIAAKRASDGFIDAEAVEVKSRDDDRPLLP